MKSINLLNQKLAEQDKSYQRAQMQTYMTGPEWRNVDMADEFAQFVETNKPFYQFPYFSQMFDFWKIVGNSVRAARSQNCSWREILLSDYFIMDLFIGSFTTIEYLTKGIFSLPFKAFAYLTNHQANNTETQTKISELFRNYADFIHHTPFYDFKYTQWVPQLWSTFWHSPNKSFDDVLSLLYYTIELPLRGLISTPISWIYNSDSNQAYETIDVVFSKKLTADETIEEDSHRLNQALDNIHEQHPSAPKGQLQALPTKDLATLNSDLHSTIATEKDGSYAYINGRLPRYEPLITAIQKINEQGYKVERIAGQEHVQLKCKIESTQEDLPLKLKSLIDKLHMTVLYQYQNHINPNLHFIMLDVLCSELDQVMTKIQDTQKVDLALIHDF